MTTLPIIGPEWLDKQLSVPLSKSFIRLDFRLVMNYLLLKRNEEKFGLTLNEVELEDFSELIETAFNATCDEQHLEFVRKCDKSQCFKNQLNVENCQRRHEKCSPTIIKWALLEASKYCLKYKLTHNESDTKQFLSLLKSETASAFHHSDRINRQYLIVFLWYLERLWSQSPSQDLIESWFDRNRRLIARLCLIVDRPHDSWRHVNLKLLTDLSIRYSTRGESQLLVDSVNKISMSRAIQSLNTDEWKSNLRLMALSAREMDDNDLIYGLGSLIKTSDIVNKNWQHMSLIRCNMDRNFEETYRQFLESFKKTNESTTELVQTLDQSCLIEFLDACIELGRLNQHADMLDLLKSEDHKLLYKMCIDSERITCREECDDIYDVVKHWVSTWTLEPGCEMSETVRPASSLLNLAEVVTESLQYISTLDSWEEFPISFKITRDFGSGNNCIFNVVRTDTTCQGILQRGPLTRKQTPIFRVRKPVELENISPTDQKLPQLVEKFFFSAEVEGAEIPEEEIASCKILAHVKTLKEECTRAATIGLITKILDNQYQAIQQDQTQIDSDLLNTSFNYDMQLLLLSTEDGYASVEYPIAETAATVLDKIKNHASLLSESNLKLFKRSLLPHVTKTWSKLKNNLVSLATSCPDMPKVWTDAIIDVIHAIAVAQPEVLLYECLVSRLDLQCQLAGYNSQLSEKPDKFAVDESLLLHSHDHQPLAYKRRDQYLRHLIFWEGVYKHILEKGEESISDWANVIAQTETFLKEIRKISYLPGEYLKSLTTRLNRRLNLFLNTFKKHADPRTGQIRCQKYLGECRARLNAIYKQDSKSISVLKIYFERKIARNERTVYESNLSADLIGPLKELEYRFQLLVSKKTLISSELEKLIKSITGLISLCHTKVIRVHHAFKQRLYLESISPFLSRLKSGSVLMPEYIDSDNTCSSNSIYHSEAQQKSSYVTIHKISQNVQMIHSKTAPKKISFIGSDGVTRSYLLKAHEDLRLDRLLMELSGAINSVLACQKDLAKYGYSLKRYSVTPVSNRSGLIQWVEAPSLHSFYRTWFNSPAGQSIMKGLYDKTCSVLCARPKSKDSKYHICKPPTLEQTIEPFYQLLWAQIKKQDVRAIENPTRPNSVNTSRYRQELPGEVYEDVVEQLIANIPQDFIANELWLTSSDSRGYYLSTRNFIRSCAAHSIFGYIIGLGDRHPDNILLDLKSGRVTHIDHNVCFEAGCDMLIPERVPFRLTQSMVRAFGFAGLEGGFTLSCQRILRVLRESKHVILNHLVPENLTFMTNQDANTSGVRLDHTPPKQGLPKRTMSDLTVKAPHFSPTLMKQPEEEWTHGDGWDRVPNDPPRVARGGWYDDGWGVDDRGWGGANADGGWHANDGWVSDVPEEPRGYVDSDDGSEYYDYTPTRVSRPPRVRLQVHDIEEVSEDTMFLPQVLPPPENEVDNCPADDFQINIKTPKKITTEQAHNVQTRVRDKLTGNDEQLRSKVLASKSSSNVATRKKEPVESGKDLMISPNQEALSIEDQVNCMITEALSNKNKAAMYEGWSPWV